MRGVLVLAALAGVGWYAYRNLMGGGSRNLMGGGSRSLAVEGDPFAEDGAAQTGDVQARVARVANRAAETARQATSTAVERARAAMPGSRGAATDETTVAEPPEARAAAMAAMPAVQAPATLPEP